jgi:release factor glutamine methyltransferase
MHAAQTSGAASAPPTLLAALRASADHLAARGVAEPRLDAERLFAHVLGVDRLRLYLDFERPLTPPERDALRAAIQRRGRREPLEYVTGRTGFRDLELGVGPGVLVPRSETEEVVEAALAVLPAAGPLRLLDLGTGSGCIALALLAERPDATAVAVDASEAALAVARANAANAGLADRVDFVMGDLYGPLDRPMAGPLDGGERFDLIVSNPPYLTPAEWAAAPPEVREHEPREALVGGDDGLQAHRRIFAGAADRLAPGGKVVVEIGHTQGPDVAAIAREAGFAVEVRPDLAGRDRIVVARLEGDA